MNTKHCFQVAHYHRFHHFASIPRLHVELAIPLCGNVERAAVRTHRVCVCVRVHTCERCVCVSCVQCGILRARVTSNRAGPAVLAIRAYVRAKMPPF